MLSFGLKGAIAGRGAEVASAKGVLNEVQGRGQLQDSLPKHADPDMFFYSGLVRSKSNLYPNTSRSGTSPLKQVNFLILDDNFVQGHINFLIFLTLVVKANYIYAQITLVVCDDRSFRQVFKALLNLEKVEKKRMEMFSLGVLARHLILMYRSSGNKIVHAYAKVIICVKLWVATNSVVEHRAVIIGLPEAFERRYKHICAHGDY
ncbi:hypothetical protein E3N88_05446 [Mikania micrantha]|uniref:Uncharacterized protein n=1 Tax=Mikania micrantha TaxID=192012 RepID=A0A5N6PN50_9ASTR|nr:hypothetical protein E3N88_05446 [Mikania micrantha]